jgi:hypothetical protein
MVSAFWQQPLTQDDAARWMGTRPIGTPASRIVQLSRRGFDVIYATGASATLDEWLNQGIPPILFVRTGDLRPYWTVNTPHAVVLAGLQGDDGVLFDPGLDVAPAYVSLGDILLAWLHTDNAYAILRPTH